MKGKLTLYIDQWGSHFYARTVKDLCKQIGMGKSWARKMYRDKKDGSVVHCGYVVGRHWLTAYQPVEIAA